MKRIDEERPASNGHVVGYGHNGVAVPPGSVTSMVEQMTQRMVQLYREPTLRRGLSTAARRTAERLSWRAELDRLDESYREVCEAWARRTANQRRVSSAPDNRRRGDAWLARGGE